MTTETSRTALSEEYISVGVQANIALGSQGVNIAVVDVDDTLVTADLVAASWVSAAGLSNTARLDPDTYTAGTYNIYVQIEGSPEIPVLYAGRMQVTE